MGEELDSEQDVNEESSSAESEADGSETVGDIAQDSGQPDVESAGSGSGWTALETAKLHAEIKELKDKYIRSVAETDNIQKRHSKERSELLRYAGESIARDLVDVVDDLERACAQSAASDAAELLRGVQLIRDRFISVLDRHGIKSAEAIGKPFDPKEHEALTSVPTVDHPPGTVVEQFRKAYFFKDKLLRPAQVVVAAAPPAAAASPDSEPADSGSDGES